MVIRTRIFAVSFAALIAFCPCRSASAEETDIPPDDSGDIIETITQPPVPLEEPQPIEEEAQPLIIEVPGDGTVITLPDGSVGDCPNGTTAILVEVPGDEPQLICNPNE